MNSVFFRVWKYPILLALLTIFGLLAALIGTGTWHVLSWITLLIPVVVCIRFGYFYQK
ncbi:MAG TPA: hypothetical protein VD884_09225 [Ohtaekwangia sp.]|nr:hypothetical protein [Ohtaekwangia sp.]